jgi:hypothetical protein
VHRTDCRRLDGNMADRLGPNENAFSVGRLEVKKTTPRENYQKVDGTTIVDVWTGLFYSVSNSTNIIFRENHIVRCSVMFEVRRVFSIFCVVS